MYLQNIIEEIAAMQIDKATCKEEGRQHANRQGDRLDKRDQKTKAARRSSTTIGYIRLPCGM